MIAYIRNFGPSGICCGVMWQLPSIKRESVVSSPSGLSLCKERGEMVEVEWLKRREGV